MTINLPSIGSETEKGVVSALDDLFGPSFREVGEYLADKVRHHRLRALTKIVSKAKALGPGATDYLLPPPMKFLLPFMESSSLEDENDDLLCDMWAKLLVDASTLYDIKQVHFIRILKEISGREARLLDALVHRSRGDPGIVINDIGFAHYELNSATASHFLKANVDQIQDNELASLFLREHELPGSHVDFLYLTRRANGYLQEIDDNISGLTTELSKEFGGITFSLLASASLIEKVRCDVVEYEGRGLEFTAWVLTDLGADFYRECAVAAFGPL